MPFLIWYLTNLREGKDKQAEVASLANPAWLADIFPTLLCLFLFTLPFPLFFIYITGSLHLVRCLRSTNPPHLACQVL